MNRQSESKFPENCIWVSSLSFLTLTPVAPLKMMLPDFGCGIISSTSARCYSEKVQIEYKLSPTGSWVWTIGPQLVMLFWKVAEPLFLVPPVSERWTALLPCSQSMMDFIPSHCEPNKPFLLQLTLDRDFITATRKGRNTQTKALIGITWVSLTNSFESIIISK